MKTFATLSTLLVLTWSGLAQQWTQPFDKDTPLAEGVQLANKQFPDIQPVTEQELIAAVKAIKLMHPDIKEDVYENYMRVVRERVLPKGMSFRRISQWDTNAGRLRVDWLDLCLEGHVATAKERDEMLSRRPNLKDSDEIRVGGFAYRLRARFVSPIEQ
jgi:hypothetical protein